MKRKEICLVVDVETCGGFGRPLVYDLGIAAVVRRTGEIIESHSLVLDEIFYGESALMESAYYAEKIPFYHEGISNGAFRVVSVWEAWRIVRRMMEKHNITRVYAYNCAFDKNALNSTMKYHTANKCRNFFPYGTEFCDIWHMACQTVLSQKRYRKFAHAHGFVSEAGNLRTSAECAYAYLTGTPDYVEPHTGLEDVRIETEILSWVLRQKKRISEAIVHNPWRIPQEVSA
jgi:hypothetical protein